MNFCSRSLSLTSPRVRRSSLIASLLSDCASLTCLLPSRPAQRLRLFVLPNYTLRERNSSTFLRPGRTNRCQSCSCSCRFCASWEFFGWRHLTARRHALPAARTQASLRESAPWLARHPSSALERASTFLGITRQLRTSSGTPWRSTPSCGPVRNLGAARGTRSCASSEQIGGSNQLGGVRPVTLKVMKDNIQFHIRCRSARDFITVVSRSCRCTDRPGSKTTAE